MVKYKDIHNSLTKKVINNILKERKINISIINKSNFVLLGISIFIVFFLFFITLLIYKSGFILLIEASEKTINIINFFFSLLGLNMFYSTLLFGYVFYFIHLFFVIKNRKEIFVEEIIYKGIYIFIGIYITLFIILFFLVFFYKAIEIINTFSLIYVKYTIYGYFCLFLISLIFYLLEYIYKSKSNYLEFYLLLVLSIFPPLFSYKLLSNNNRNIISNGFSKIDESELKEINSYLIYGNKIENYIKRGILLAGWFYIIVQLLIGKFTLSKDKIINLIMSDLLFSIVLFFLIIAVLSIFRIFFTPSLIRSSYYVYLKENNKLTDI